VKVVVGCDDGRGLLVRSATGASFIPLPFPIFLMLPPLPPVAGFVGLSDTPDGEIFFVGAVDGISTGIADGTSTLPGIFLAYNTPKVCDIGLLPGSPLSASTRFITSGVSSATMINSLMSS
jgi:hypothetical protein